MAHSSFTKIRIYCLCTNLLFVSEIFTVCPGRFEPDVLKALFNGIKLLFQQSSLVKQGSFSFPRFLIFKSRIRHNKQDIFKQLSKIKYGVFVLPSWDLISSHWKAVERWVFPLFLALPLDDLFLEVFDIVVIYELPASFIFEFRRFEERDHRAKEDH